MNEHTPKKLCIVFRQVIKIGHYFRKQSVSILYPSLGKFTTHIAIDILLHKAVEGLGTI